MIRAGLAAAIALLALTIVVAAWPAREAEAASISVWSAADGGPGSFRQAVLDANANPSITTIVLRNVLPITLSTEVAYSGNQNLTVRGDSPFFNRVVQGNGSSCGLFTATGKGDLTFSRVTFRNSECDGIVVVAPAGAGELVVKLDDVVLEDILKNGVNVSDNGADASLKLTMTRSRIVQPGILGVRVSESGAGSATVSMSTSEVTDAGDAGVFLREADNGDLTFSATGSRVTGSGQDGADTQEGGTGNLVLSLNGSQFSGSGQSGFSASEYDDGDASLTGAVLQFTGNTGFGIAVFENGEGNINANLSGVNSSDNSGAGLRLEESNEGDASITVSGSSSNDSKDSDGMTVLEIGEGNLSLWLSSVVLNGNDDAGLSAFEGGGGRAQLTVLLSRMEFNGSAGASAGEYEDGDLQFAISGSTARANGSGGGSIDGFLLTESGNGSLLGTFSSSSALDNYGDGYSLDERDSGAFDVTMALSTAAGNGNYGTRASAGGATGTLHALASNVDPYITTNVLVVP